MVDSKGDVSHNITPAQVMKVGYLEILRKYLEDARKLNVHANMEVGNRLYAELVLVDTEILMQKGRGK